MKTWQQRIVACDSCPDVVSNDNKSLIQHTYTSSLSFKKMLTQGSIGFVLVFLVLGIIRPPFVVKKENNYKRVMWRVVFMISIMGGIASAVLPCIYKM